LDVALGRRIIEFHNSRHIQPRHGRRIVRQGQIYYRWCFSDLASARAFIEEFGGASCETSICEAQRIAVNIAKLPELLTKPR
jgi:hypothetical protein